LPRHAQKLLCKIRLSYTKDIYVQDWFAAAVRAIVASVKDDTTDDVRWRKVPTKAQQAWMRRRKRITRRSQADILGEVLRRGQVAFDAAHNIERIRK
jgi:hypothetical protein